MNGEVTSDQMKSIRVELNKYAVNDIFNADESALYYRLLLTTTMGPGPLLGRKKRSIESRSWYIRTETSLREERVSSLAIQTDSDVSLINLVNVSCLCTAGTRELG